MPAATDLAAPGRLLPSVAQTCWKFIRVDLAAAAHGKRGSPSQLMPQFVIERSGERRAVSMETCTNKKADSDEVTTGLVSIEFFGRDGVIRTHYPLHPI